MAGLLERYQDGDHDRVWHELRQLGSQVGALEHRTSAEGVVRESMLRIRRNVVTVVERLREQGYRFGDPWGQDGAQEPYAPPDQSTPAFVQWLETRWAPLPLTVRLWIEVVRDVNLQGVHPAWPEDFVADPLIVEFEYKSWRWAQKDRGSVRQYFDNEYEARQDNEAASKYPGVFVLDVAPDALHKANISGGPPYGVLLPDGSVDATFRFEDGLLLPFLEYLRLAFRCGGFPGLWKRDPGGKTSAIRRALSEGLLEL